MTCLEGYGRTVQPDPTPSEQDSTIPDARKWGRHTWELSETERGLEEKYGASMQTLLFNWRWRERKSKYEIAELCGVNPSTVTFWIFKHRVRQEDLSLVLPEAPAVKP